MLPPDLLQPLGVPALQPLGQEGEFVPQLPCGQVQGLYLLDGVQNLRIVVVVAPPGCLPVDLLEKEAHRGDGVPMGFEPVHLGVVPPAFSPAQDDGLAEESLPPVCAEAFPVQVAGVKGP